MPVNFNSHLREIILIGSAKRPLELTQLPIALQEVLSAKHLGNSEELLLNALSLDYYYHMAGNLPPKFTGEIDTTPITEEQQIAPVELAGLAKRILDSELTGKNILLLQWINMMSKNAYIVSPEHILMLLIYGRTCSNEIRNKLSTVLGNKGKWIMEQQGTQYKSALEAKLYNDVWLEGNTEDRMNYLKQLRSTNKSAALSSIELIKSTWNQEPVKEKLNILKILRSTVSEDDKAFLEELYQGEFAFSTKEKKLQKACRKVIAQTLLSIPSSNLQEATLKSLNIYLKKSSGFFSGLTGKTKIEFKVPEKEDDFFNLKCMSEVYGFDDVNPDIARFKTDQLYWFSCLVEAIPIESWNSLFHSKTNETVTFLLHDDQFQNIIQGVRKGNLVNALITLASHGKNQDLIKSLLQNEILSGNQELITLLSAENWEKYMLDSKLHFNSFYLATFKATGNSQWSASFTTAWLKLVIADLKENKVNPEYRLGNEAAMYFNTTCIEVLSKFNNTEAYTLNLNDYWQKYIYAPIIECVRIRSILNQYN